MRRITPRTCLWPVAFTLVITFVLSIGLTYRSDHYCYAGTCGEWLFPLQARLHVVVWYLWISLSVTFLAIRTFSMKLRDFLRSHVIERKLPLLDKHLNLSGILVFTWICILYASIIGVWWVHLRDYFVERGIQGGVFDGNKQLAAIALTGHFCDVTMGMVLLPISRHSALASFFKLSVSTTLAFHMLTAYTLFALVTIHGLLYASWLPIFSALSRSLQKVYPVLNPTYLYYETWPGNTHNLGIWRASLVFTGLFATIIMCLIFITTLPRIRRRHFNAFYFSHLTVIGAVIVICLHASTMFYCTSPGLVLWLLDWALRVYELSKSIDANVTPLSNRYFLLTMKMPRKRLGGCACTSPLAHFYIYHSESSVRELHPFTTITHLASEKCKDLNEDISVQFLFQKRGETSEIYDAALDTRDVGFLAWLHRFLVAPKKKTKMEWTAKLASHARLEVETPQVNSTDELNMQKSVTDLIQPGDLHPVVDIRLRLEGPYFTPSDPYQYHTVICLVAGSGISGGIAIVNAFAEANRQRSMEACNLPASHACITVARNSRWERCVLVWSVREDDYTDIPSLKAMSTPGLEVQTQLTGGGRPRMDFEAMLSSLLPDSRVSVWVYLSGPNEFIIAGEKACIKAGVDYYGARWEL